MTLHPEIATFIAGLPTPPEGPLDPVAMRAADEAHVAPLEERLPLHAVDDVTAQTASGEVPVRIYTPVEADSYGVLVYFHGGAFFLGSLETHDHVARSLAKETGLKVVSVDYRLAPEAAFPAGLDDCYAVVRWATEETGSLAWDGTTLALAGDSSGGTFVAAVAARAHDDGFHRITHQVLYYPSLDLDFDVDRYASLRENAVGYGMETAGLKPFNAFYVDSGADPADPLVSPIKRADLTGLPPALVVTAEYDPLRDEGELYGRRLREAGVESTVSRYEGAGHGFVQHFSWIPEYHGVFAQTRDFLGRR
ncbi:alpha/beta hydrolase [Streptomyces sp. NBC_01221]|uniref:alpha/beta hydrolase n=1 Tax=unclassified Streptomyces TaxID=2593676 RepID=UPI0022529431|nr:MULTISPECIES: alpha/beta hydrolase [unclassified Streptomyces]MCX4789954.1 alpha/beta hydrolase [Streptomyces sp. NBC_01221]MCX4794340.1 alpha/beta hydrolase [Streptomyces sp. NBC_01242]WSP58209.1 alpha/beta hydrolase [Streptomyces sp. NBC_01241]